MGRCYEHQTEAQGRSIPSGPCTMMTPSSLCPQKALGQPPSCGRGRMHCSALSSCLVPAQAVPPASKRHVETLPRPPPAAPNPKRGSLEATDTIFLLLDPKQ